MARDGRDRYGNRHRDDADYDVGESKPGDVGDSKGTFHDRARKSSNVIVDGKTQSIESHRRSSTEASTEQSSSRTSKRNSNTSTDSIPQSDADGQVVELTIESDGGTHDTMATYKNHQVHVEGGTPGETIRVRLEKGPGYLIGRRVSVRE